MGRPHTDRCLSGFVTRSSGASLVRRWAHALEPLRGALHPIPDLGTMGTLGLALA